MKFINLKKKIFINKINIFCRFDNLNFENKNYKKNYQTKYLMNLKKFVKEIFIKSNGKKMIFA